MAQLHRSEVARTVLSAWAWFALGVAHLVSLPLVAATWVATPNDPGKYRAGLRFRKLAVIHQRLNPLWRFTVSGRIPSDPRCPYVVVANHESFVDILLIAHLPFEMKWLSKSDFFRYPLTGWMMRMARDIRLDRGDPESGRRALEQCRDRLSKKVSVMIFPEGTRSHSGALQPFKEGAFRLAIEEQVPILPLAVVGTRGALVKHDWRYGSVHAEVRVLDPIPTEGLVPDDVVRLQASVRDAMERALTDLRAEHGLPNPIPLTD